MEMLAYSWRPRHFWSQSNPQGSLITEKQGRWMNVWLHFVGAVTSDNTNEAQNCVCFSWCQFTFQFQYMLLFLININCFSFQITKIFTLKQYQVINILW